jgi:hypothetical protein
LFVFEEFCLSNLIHHPVCGFAAATPPCQEGRSPGISNSYELLYSYLRQYWPLVILTLILATINQVFSLLDPAVFRIIIDNYVSKFANLSHHDFFYGVGKWLAAAVGVAFVSRVAKNFQDYFTNVITQRMGAQMYADGIRHSLELPYSVFEDQRSGETLGKLTKARADTEKVSERRSECPVSVAGWNRRCDDICVYGPLVDCGGVFPDDTRAFDVELDPEFENQTRPGGYFPRNRGTRWCNDRVAAQH